MKAKNTFALILALSLIFPLAACNSADDPGQEVIHANERLYWRNGQHDHNLALCISDSITCESR